MRKNYINVLERCTKGCDFFQGYLVMTNDWFHEFVFEIVVDKKFCSQEVLDVFKLEPKVLPAWDPMGALARN